MLRISIDFEERNWLGPLKKRVITLMNQSYSPTSMLCPIFWFHRHFSPLLLLLLLLLLVFLLSRYPFFHLFYTDITKPLFKVMLGRDIGLKCGPKLPNAMVCKRDLNDLLLQLIIYEHIYIYIYRITNNK